MSSALSKAAKRMHDTANMLHKPRESTVPREEKAGMPREQVYDTPEKAEFVGEPPPAATGDEPGGRPLAILFSTNRAVPSERAPAKSAAAGGVNAAFSGALSNGRGLRLLSSRPGCGCKRL